MQTYFGSTDASILSTPCDGRASPRSASFTVKSLVTKKFKDLISQCISPLECKKATPAQQSLAIFSLRSIGMDSPKDSGWESPQPASNSPALVDDETDPDMDDRLDL